jgi:hypothetical protein
MNTDTTQMKIFNRHHSDKPAMASVSIPPRRKKSFFSCAEGARDWTDVPIYPTYVQRQIYQPLSASHLRPSVVKNVVNDFLRSKKT